LNNQVAKAIKRIAVITNKPYKDLKRSYRPKKNSRKRLVQLANQIKVAYKEKGIDAKAIK
jgi:hypothetical protein